MTISYLNSEPEAWMTTICINAISGTKVYSIEPVIMVICRDEECAEKVREKLKKANINFKEDTE